MSHTLALFGFIFGLIAWLCCLGFIVSITDRGGKNWGTFVFIGVLCGLLSNALNSDAYGIPLENKLQSKEISEVKRDKKK